MRREREIQQLVRALTTRRGTTITGVVAMSGAGKMELAKIVADQVRARYRDGVLWVDCDQQQMATTGGPWADQLRRAAGRRGPHHQGCWLAQPDQ